jgi:hypothetical protein
MDTYGYLLILIDIGALLQSQLAGSKYPYEGRGAGVANIIRRFEYHL